jgi:hypothetical protein
MTTADTQPEIEERSMTTDDTQPTLSPKLLTDDKDMLIRAVEKWLKFQTAMWNQINDKLERRIRASEMGGMAFRIVIITISAALTTLSDWQGIEGWVIRLIAGVLTALTGIEAYLKLTERQTESRRQQREMEALRDRLRFAWFVNVEIQPDMIKRLDAAKKLLEEGPREFNEILNKYYMKASPGDAPTMNQ